MTATDEIVRLDGVSKIFRRPGHEPVRALQNVSLTIPRGETVGIIGRSGAGKSTLIRLINGLERPEAGRILVDGIDISTLKQAELRRERRKIGMIFQHFNLLSSRTVFDNVAFPLELAHMPGSRIRERVDQLLDLVGLSDKRRRYPAELSGGQQQRVGIARALATEPKILLSDEATSALDPETTGAILDLLAKINRELSVTVVLITHQMSVIKAICDRVGVIEDGAIVEQGSVYEVFSRPKSPTTKSFVGYLLDAALPAGIATALRADRVGAERTILRLVFAGEALEAPILSRIARDWNVDISILHGQMDNFGEISIGVFIVALPASVLDDDGLGNFLSINDVAFEVLGHVS